MILNWLKHGQKQTKQNRLTSQVPARPFRKHAVSARRRARVKLHRSNFLLKLWLYNTHGTRGDWVSCDCGYGTSLARGEKATSGCWVSDRRDPGRQDRRADAAAGVLRAAAGGGVRRRTHRPLAAAATAVARDDGRDGASGGQESNPQKNAREKERERKSERDTSLTRTAVCSCTPRIQSLGLLIHINVCVAY